MGSPILTEKASSTASTSPVQTNPEAPKTTNTDTKDAVKTETVKTDSLAPPPRPAPAVGNTPDYFSANHGHLSSETNPFEFSFGGGSNTNGTVQTPGGTKLPSVAALTSPNGPGSGITPGFWGSLRSGPLSPAMLSGPKQGDDYFSDSHHMRGGFPTPTVSDLRTGLTPGGGGSMFPEPSPNSQALYNSLASGGATPSTLDFHRTAMSAAAATKLQSNQGQNNITSQPHLLPQSQDLSNNMDVKPPHSGHFDQHDANDAANGLYLLAQSRSSSQTNNHYPMSSQMPVHAHSQSMNMQMGGQSSETSPTMANRNHNSTSTNSGRALSEGSNTYSDDNDHTSRPNTRGKGKRGTSDNQTNGRRKTGDTPAKGHASKKSKGNNGHAMSVEPPSDEEPDLTKDEYNANGKKMTDEEKRKNFLERNRVAALKCRQRKKQWLANLQQKVELYTAENDNLNSQITQLRDEVVHLKTILLAHKDCPVSHQQGINGIGMHQLMEQGSFGGQLNNPYGMAANMANQQAQTNGAMNGQNSQRRYS